MGKYEIVICGLACILIFTIIKMMVLEKSFLEQIDILWAELRERSRYNLCDICKHYLYDGKDMNCSPTGRKNSFSTNCDYFEEKEIQKEDDYQ